MSPVTSPSSPLAAMREDQLLKEMHILLVLEQRAIERRNGFLRIVGAQRLRRDVFSNQQLDPVEQLGSRWLLFETRHLAYFEERRQGFREQVLLERRVVHVDDGLHRRGIRKT